MPKDHAVLGGRPKANGGHSTGFRNAPVRVLAWACGVRLSEDKAEIVGRHGDWILDRKAPRFSRLGDFAHIANSPVGILSAQCLIKFRIAGRGVRPVSLEGTVKH